MNFGERLRQATRSEPIPLGLETRIRARLEQRQQPWPTRWRLGLAAAAACLSGALFLGYEYGHFRWTEASQEAYVVRVADQLSGLLRVGLADHLHCALFGRYPKKGPALDKVAKALGPSYAVAGEAMVRALGPGYRLAEAHICVYLDREFVHLVAKSDDRLVSLLVTEKHTGESLPSGARGPASIHEAAAERFGIAAAETDRHAIYLVGDIDPRESGRVLAAILGHVRQAVS